MPLPAFAPLLLPLGALFGAMPFDPAPAWQSAENAEFFTGGVLVDMDDDGDQEFVSSAGNDMKRAANFVWRNDGGVLAGSATWVSADRDYSGHCAAGDLDGDGFPELAVANYLSSSGGATQSQLYRNFGGTLESSPSWLSGGDTFYSFSCAFGDPDGDGDLDLAFACGEQYSGVRERGRVFRNLGGTLESTPSWQMAQARMSYDTQWVDVDQDGDLDLSFISAEGPALIYRNVDGVVETTPAWESADADDGNSLIWGDVNNDGFPDLVTANNDQLGGDGYFELYLNQGGWPATLPVWKSASRGYGAAVALADFDFDGDLDLAAGRWWSRVAIYENVGGTFSADPVWECDPSYESVAEEIAIGDVDGDGVRYVVFEPLAVGGGRKLFYLRNQPAVEILALRADGELLARGDYCADPAAGWVSLAAAPAQSLEVAYAYSIKPDFSLANWDRANFLFSNRLDVGKPLALRLRGHNLPLLYGPAGGTLSLDYTVANNLPASQSVEIWLMARRPGGPRYGPFLREELWLDPLRSVGSAELSHALPAGLPAGDYTVTLYAGVYPDAPADSTSLHFIKSSGRGR